MPAVFFDFVLGESLKLYYGQRQSQPGLGYDGPPQPEGFEVYAEPPAG